MSGEKTFAPTAKRKDDAAKKGDVLRSRELGAAVSVLAGFAALAFAGPLLGERLIALVKSAFVFDHASIVSGPTASDAFSQAGEAMVPVAILGLVLSLVTAGSQLVFASGRWLPGNMAPKASRLDPLKGLQRVFGPTGWIEMLKGLLKVGLLGAIAYVWGRGWWADMLGMARGTLDRQVALAWDAIISLGIILGAGLLLIAFIDLPVQAIRRLNRLKMTQEEVKQEHKESDGSPEAKAHRRQRQRDIAAGALAPAMREAQFVVTNPTHFAIALAYDPAKAPAPIVLAKGRGDKALVMRELAGERALPVLESPALARSIYYTTREKQMIHSELYGAVAAIVAYVFALGRGETPAFPQLQVPVNLRFDADGRREG